MQHSAYPVPFRFDREFAPCVMAAALDPGGVLRVRIRGDDLARSTVLMVRWLRPDGSDYLWRISF